jgi:hypothetical protein
MRLMKYFAIVLFCSVVFFPIGSAHANITRSCTAKYRIHVDAPDAIRGSEFDTPDFSAVGGCGLTVPNRCRDRASEKLMACFRAQFSNPRIVPAECSEVRSYPITGSLESYIKDNACRRYPGNSEITVRVFPSIRGDTHCDCNPWSDRVLDCPVSNPIKVACFQVGTIVPGALSGIEVQPIPAADQTAPTVTITNPTTSPSYSSGITPLTLRGTASDAVGVTRVAWRNDRGGSGTCTGTTNWTCSGITLREGSNNITITADDAAGNHGTDSLAVTYTAPGSEPPSDTISPTITITSPTTTSTYRTRSSPITVGGSASDNIAVTQIRWANDLGGSGTCTGTTNWTCSGITLSDGTNNITVTADDAAGNHGTDRISISYDRGR